MKKFGGDGYVHFLINSIGIYKCQMDPVVYFKYVQFIDCRISLSRTIFFKYKKANFSSNKYRGLFSLVLSYFFHHSNLGSWIFLLFLFYY